MRCPQSRPATISCRQTMTASKTFGGGAGIGGAGERRRFESRLSLTYTTNGRPQKMRMGLSWTEVNAFLHDPRTCAAVARSRRPGAPITDLPRKVRGPASPGNAASGLQVLPRQ